MPLGLTKRLAQTNRKVPSAKSTITIPYPRVFRVLRSTKLPLLLTPKKKNPSRSSLLPTNIEALGRQRNLPDNKKTLSLGTSKDRGNGSSATFALNVESCVRYRVRVDIYVYTHAYVQGRTRIWYLRVNGLEEMQFRLWCFTCIDTRPTHLLNNVVIVLLVS